MRQRVLLRATRISLPIRRPLAMLARQRGESAKCKHKRWRESKERKRRLRQSLRRLRVPRKGFRMACVPDLRSVITRQERGPPRFQLWNQLTRKLEVYFYVGLSEYSGESA